MEFNNNTLGLCSPFPWRHFICYPINSHKIPEQKVREGKAGEGMSLRLLDILKVKRGAWVRSKPRAGGVAEITARPPHNKAQVAHWIWCDSPSWRLASRVQCCLLVIRLYKKFKTHLLCIRLHPGRLCLEWEWVGVEVRKRSLSRKVKGEDQCAHH